MAVTGTLCPSRFAALQAGYPAGDLVHVADFRFWVSVLGSRVGAVTCMSFDSDVLSL